MAHHHHHSAQSKGWILHCSLIATVLFTALEVFAGFRARSLALLSDAGHNFTDALALGLAALGLYFQGRPANSAMTFGYQRAGVITAFLNAATLIVISLFIFSEAVSRLLHPAQVDNNLMFWIACIALVLNGGIMLALSSGKSDINIRAAFIHMLGDAIGAGAIIIGALVIRLTNWTYVDPLLSIALGALIIYTAWDVGRESLNILLEGLPRGIELGKVTTALAGIDGVLDVHDLHIWSLGSNIHALSSHVLIEDMPPSASEAILKRINDALCRFGIHHTTIQFKHVPCVFSDGGCRMTPAHTHDDEHGHNH